MKYVRCVNNAGQESRLGLNKLYTLTKFSFVEEKTISKVLHYPVYESTGYYRASRFSSACKPPNENIKVL